MSMKQDMYCLDANVLIEAWQKYYNPKFCPDYWSILNELGDQEIIFIPEMVYQEITRTEDELAKWLKGSKIPIKNITEPVTLQLKDIYAKNSVHKSLVDSTKARSLADPWLLLMPCMKKRLSLQKKKK